MNEKIKQRIGIFIAVFQYGITTFIGTGVSFITYWLEQKKFDVVLAIHVAIMLAAISAALFYIIEADKQTELL